MANKSLTDLTARTATADSDLLHINSGGTDYKETKADFADDLAQRASFNNTSDIKTQAGALSRSNKLYYGICNSYGHQTETGSPINANFYITVHVNSSTSKCVELIVIGQSGRRFQAFQNSGAWTAWEELPARSEITSLNNNGLRKADHYFSGSFTTNSSGYVLLGSIPSSFDVTISDFYVTFLIRGWSGGSGSLSLVVGSNGTDLYLTSTPNTTVTGITVRLWYVKSVLT